MKAHTQIQLRGFAAQSVLSIEEITRLLEGLSSAHLAGLDAIVYDPTRFEQKLDAYYSGAPGRRVDFRCSGEYVRGVPHGVWTEWYDNGQTAVQGHWDGGLRDGSWTSWQSTRGPWAVRSTRNTLRPSRRCCTRSLSSRARRSPRRGAKHGGSC